MKYLNIFFGIFVRMQPNTFKYFHLKLFFGPKIFYVKPNIARVKKKGEIQLLQLIPSRFELILAFLKVTNLVINPT